MAECIDCPKETQNGNHRSLFYKKPISRNNFKLEIDYDDSPQEIRRQKFLDQQKRLVFKFIIFNFIYYIKSTYL